MFSSANTALNAEDRQSSYDIVLASPSGGDVKTDTGIVVGTVSLRAAADAAIDTLLVSGGVGVFDALEEEHLLSWVVANHENCRRVATTCMGAFVTAKAQLLTGKRVATHWRYADDLQSQFPEVIVEKDPLFVCDGKMWSAAGVTSGIDLALAMVEDDHDHHIAMQIAQALVVFFKRPGGQSQFSNVLVAQEQDERGTFSKLHSWIANHLQYDLSVEALAQKSGMSPRTFARVYKQRVGCTPAKSVEIMRVDSAKRLLEYGTQPLKTIARQTGLGDEQRLRRAFVRHVGVLPADYRQTFGARIAV